MDPDSQYQPGIRNIGQKEISVRKKFLYFFIITTAFLTAWSFHYCDSVLCWIAMLLSSFAMTVLFFEVKYHFCILFGFFNLYNFGKLGNLQDVKDEEDGQKDRKRVAHISLVSLFISMSYTSLVHWLAMMM